MKTPLCEVCNKRPKKPLNKSKTKWTKTCGFRVCLNVLASKNAERNNSLFNMSFVAKPNKAFHL